MENLSTLFQHLENFETGNGRGKQARRTVEMTPYSLNYQSRDSLTIMGYQLPVFFSGKANCKVIRRDENHAPCDTFPVFWERYAEACSRLDLVHAGFVEKKRGLGSRLLEIKGKLKEKYSQEKPASAHGKSASFIELENEKVQLLSKLGELGLREKKALVKENERIKADLGLEINKSGAMYALMFKSYLYLNTSENILALLPEMETSFTLGNGLPHFCYHLDGLASRSDDAVVLVHNALCICGADEVYVRIFLESGQVFEYDVLTGKKLRQGASHIEYDGDEFELLTDVDAYKNEIIGVSFSRNFTGPTTQGLSELQRALATAKAFDSDLYCTLPGEQYKQQIGFALDPLRRVGKEKLSDTALDEYSRIIDGVVNAHYLPFIETLACEYGVKVHVANKGSALDDALGEMEEIVYGKYAELWDRENTPAFRAEVRSHVVRINGEEVAPHRIEAPFRYILYHLTVPFLALGPSALEGRIPFIKLETKGIAEISSTIAAKRLSRELGFDLSLAMLTQPYIPSPKSPRMQYLSPCREKVFLNKPESWEGLNDDEAFSQLHHLDVDPDRLRAMLDCGKTGAADMLTRELNRLHQRIYGASTDSSPVSAGALSLPVA